jgi:hypothetical protein
MVFSIFGEVFSPGKFGMWPEKHAYHGEMFQTIFLVEMDIDAVLLEEWNKEHLVKIRYFRENTMSHADLKKSVTKLLLSGLKMFFVLFGAEQFVNIYVINPLVVKNNDVAVLFAEFAYGVQMDLRS